MYCPKCGRENVDGAVRCAVCGFEFAGSGAVAAGVEAKTSRAAVAALVLGILVFFTCGITALPAIICGIVALVKISGSNGLLKGNGMAITGLVSCLGYSLSSCQSWGYSRRSWCRRLARQRIRPKT